MKTQDNVCTVAALIKKLQTMPQDLPVLVRPKYHGDLECWDSAPVKIHGVAEMRPENQPKNVTLLV